jgi:hypothetical protein
MVFKADGTALTAIYRQFLRAATNDTTAGVVNAAYSSFPSDLSILSYFLYTYYRIAKIKQSEE